MNAARRSHGDPALLRSALEAASRGWDVFPCAPGTKCPALRGNWQEHATTDPARIRDWWTFRPYNIGISCGPSGLVVIDLDAPKSGDAATVSGVASLIRVCDRERQRCPWATFTVATPSGGWHLYFRAPGRASPVPNSASRLGPLIDVRAQGGYVLAPGSRVGSRTYTPRNAALPALLPAWIAKALTAQPPPPAVTRPLPRADNPRTVPYAMAALREEARRVATACEGTRNDTLNRAAFSLGQLAAAGLLPDSGVITALAEAARQSGLPDREALRTIRSGMTAGARHPRAPRPATTRSPPVLPRPQRPLDGPRPPQQRAG